jgi:diguanylate cyclase (GGDEF)-like protein
LARRQNRSIAVLFLDLDNFKFINDSLGHDAGDKLLQAISKRLLAVVRGSDTVSRQGGDEFVILLSEIAYAEDAATSAKKVLASISEPSSIGGQALHTNGSIGISIYLKSLKYYNSRFIGYPREAVSNSCVQPQARFITNRVTTQLCTSLWDDDESFSGLVTVATPQNKENPTSCRGGLARRRQF